MCRLVSPTSIRLWILKDLQINSVTVTLDVSPTSIRLWILKVLILDAILKIAFGFTHLDPFVDTESSASPCPRTPAPAFHPPRSVCGY